MLIRPLYSTKINNYLKPAFNGDKTEKKHIGIAEVDYSNKIFIEQEKTNNALRFWDYLLETESDISSIEHANKTGAITRKYEQAIKGQASEIIQNSIKKLKK